MLPDRIHDFAIDDDNEEKFWAHKVAVHEVLELLDGRHVVVPNRSGHRAPKLVIGRTVNGRCFAVPIYPTGQVGVWRPVTAYPCNAWHEERIKRGRKER